MRNCFSFAFLIAGATAFTGPLDGFESKLTLNLDAVQSDSNTFNLRALLDTQRKSDLTTITGRFRYSYAEQRVGGINDVTTDNWLAFGLYEQVVDSAIDWFVSATLNRDRIVDLNLRQIYTGGLALKLRTEEDLRWKVRGGIGLITEDFELGNDSDSIALEIGSDYFRKLSDNISVFHLARFVPAVDDFSDYFLQSDLGLNFRMNDRTDIAFRFLVDYDKTPSAGLRKDRLQWILGVGYKF